MRGAGQRVKTGNVIERGSGVPCSRLADRGDVHDDAAEVDLRLVLSPGIPSE